MSARGPWSASGTEVSEIGTYALLQAYVGPETVFYVRGVANIFDGGHGVFRVDASDSTSADNGGTILVDAIGRRWKREFSGQVNVRWFGAVGDGSTDDTAEIQAAMDTGRPTFIPFGVYKTTAPLIIRPTHGGIVGDSSHEPSGSVIDGYGADAVIKVFDSGANKRVTAYRIENLAIKARTSGVNAIDFSHGSYGTFKNLFIRLLESNQAAIYGTGNDLGSAPYYNQFDNIKIFGNANSITYPNQRGFYFRGDASGLGANGPNANVISNCGQITGLSHGVHIESGDGNLFSNIIMESISDYAFRIGNASSAAAGRADENSIVNFWMEGTATCTLIRFEGDAHANSITNYSANSIGPILWDNQSSSADNFVKAKGNLYVVDFYGQNIPANAVTVLSPTSPAWAAIGFGGVIPPFRCVPYILQVTAQNFASGGAGSGVVKSYRTGVANPNLTFTVNNANRFGGRTIQRTPDTTQGYNTFDGTFNSQIEVVIETDATWNQTSADVHAQIVFVG